jgi:nucleotide-binding universal stress UspA family protein
MFTSIVIPLDLSENGDRALSVAASLGSIAHIPVTLLTVSSPGLPVEIDQYELHQRAISHGLDSATLVRLDSDEPAETIIRHLSDRPGADLLVMATSARGPLGQRALGSVSENILGRLNGPVLLIGPAVPAGVAVLKPALVVAVEGADHSADVSDAVTTWMRTFPGPCPTVVEVVETAAPVGTDPADAAARAHVSAVIDELASRGVEACAKTLHGGDPVLRLNDFAASLADGVLLVASHRWTDGHVHLRSTTRNLVHSATRPVLVVPV